jgi:CheY-like chemotaxis protein
MSVGKIGFLEDDKTTSLFYKEGLKKLGFESSGFTTIASFIASLPEGGFDLLLLDWSLPDGNADTVIKWVRDNLDWQIPIVVVSATDDEENIVNALWQGADDYLVKPVILEAHCNGEAGWQTTAGWRGRSFPMRRTSACAAMATRWPRPSPAPRRR